jgi:ubiquinone/menaquinone biosynthesis C-methylase UbiE
MTADDFDRWARSYDECLLQPVFRAAHDAVLCQAQRLTARPKRVLDVGCGTGRLLRVARRLFPTSDLIGVDVSGRMLSVASPAAWPTVRLAHIQAAAERLPFADGTFDLVVSTASFRHWDDHHAAMHEIGRVLAPGGLLGIADLFEPSPRRFAARLIRRCDLPPAFTAALRTAGLRTVSADMVDGFGPISAITVVLARRPAPARRNGGNARPTVTAGHPP